MADKKDSELTIKSTIVDGDLFPLLDSETAVDAEKNKTVAASTIKAYAGGVAPTLLTTVIEIGDWDMDADSSKGAIHTIDEDKIRTINVSIRKDSTFTGVNYSVIPIEAGDTVGAFGGMVNGVSSTTISLFRVTGGRFDSTDYDETSYNRGWITIQHIE